MPISIKAPEADRLARQLTAVTGETITDAIIVAMRERLVREETRRRNSDVLLEEIRAISAHCASLPLLDTRPDEDIMGWDENGLPT
jgi:antitoxin VapB